MTVPAGAATFEIPTGCASVGGTLGADGVCRLHGTGAGVNGWNATITLTEESAGLEITGSDEYGTPGLYRGALDRQKLSLTNKSSADVVFRGGSGDCSDGAVELASADYDIDYTPVPGKVVFTNKADGRFVFEAGEGMNASGVYAAAIAGGSFKLTNEGEGAVLISGGLSDLSGLARDEWAEPKAGIMYAADNASADIANCGSGVITIIGGTGGSAGIPETASAFGIYEAASDEGEFYLRNFGSGSIVIAGGSDAYGRGINRVSVEAEAVIGTAAGSMTVKGGSAAGADGIGTGSIEGTWYLLNTEGAAMLIEGGTASDAHGIRYAALTGGEALIGNSVGAMTVRSGTAEGAHGIAALTAAETAEAILLNEAGGTVTIEGGRAQNAHGIAVLSLAGSAYIGNDEGSVMLLTGTASGAALGRLNASEKGSAQIENAGLLILKAHAIGDFGRPNADGSPQFLNDPTGTLETSVATLFVGAAVTAVPVSSTAEVKFLTPEGAEEVRVVTVSGADYEFAADALSVREDWRAQAAFEEGSTVRLTDVTAGSAGEERIRDAFEAAFGSGVNLTFALPVAERQAGFADVKALIDANPGAMFYETDLETGSNAFSVTSALGLRSLGTGTAVLVEAGGELRLIGTGETAAKTPVTVREGGILLLGDAPQTVSRYGGRLTKLESAGILSVTRGSFSAEVLQNTGTAVVETGATLTIAGRPYESSNLGTITNRGTLRIEGKTESGEITNAGGRLEVAEGAGAHLTTVSGKGSIENAGVLITDAGTVTGTLVTEGITDIPAYSGGITSTLEVAEGGTLIAREFQAIGVVRASGGAIVIGTAAKTQYLLRHVDEARAIVDAGGAVSQAVLDALEAEEAETSSAGYSARSAAAATGSEADTAEEEGIELSRMQNAGTAAENSQETENEPACEECIREGAPAAETAAAPRARLNRPSVHGAAAFAAEEGARSEAAALMRAADARTSALTAVLIADAAKTDAYRMNRGGVRMGLQRGSDDFTLGTEAAFAKGDLKFDGTRTTEEASLGVYARYGTERFFMKGFAGYGRGKTDMGGVSDIRTKTLFGGLGFGTVFPVGRMTLTPHVGARGYRIRTDGASDAAFVEFPIGFSVGGALETVSGWRLMPLAGFSLVARTSDRDVTVKTGNETLCSVFAGRYRAEAVIGVSASKGDFEAAVRLTGAAGGAGLRAGGVRLLSFRS